MMSMLNLISFMNDENVEFIYGYVNSVSIYARDLQRQITVGGSDLSDLRWLKSFVLKQ